jgi:hypothetical protein
VPGLRQPVALMSLINASVVAIVERRRDGGKQNPRDGFGSGKGGP